MAILNSIQMTAPRYPTSGPGIGGRSLHILRAEFNAGTQGAAANGDVINLFKMHPRFRVVGGHVTVKGALGASTTIVVGDAGDDDRYFASLTGNTAATTTTMAETGRDYLNGGAYTMVQAKIGGANTNTSGSFVVILTGIIEEPA